MKSSWSAEKNDEFLFQRQDDQQQQQQQFEQYKLFSPFIQPFEGRIDQVKQTY
jgi:hypothetical protein